MFSPAARNKIFNAFALLMLIAAIFHLVALFYKLNDSPLWRHALFAVINIIFVSLFLRRPKYFLPLFIIFFIQQYYSHGSFMIKQWTEQHTIHWISLIELLILPIALICMVEDYKGKKTR